MKALFNFCGVAAVVLTIAACRQAPPPLPDTHVADVKAITSLEVEANRSYVARNADKLVNFYASDAILMAPGALPASGIDAIRTEINEMIADPALSLSFQAKRVDVAKSGDLAFTQGSYQMTMSDPMTRKPIKDHGSYVTIYRKEADGAWKAEVDIATSELPPSPPPPPAKKHLKR